MNLHSPNTRLPQKRRCSVGGMTLIELLLAMVLGILLIGAVVLTYLAGSASARDAEAISRVQENVRVLSEFLIRDIRNAGFRDEASLKVGHENSLRASFANIGNGELTVRYAGRGHCAQEFNTFRLVENRYFVQNGVLRCAGRQLAADAAGGAFFTEQPTVVDLVSGVVALGAEGVCSQDTNPCNCGFDLNDLENACIGVRLTLQFEGIEGGPRDLTLLAGFRNVILERINERVSN